MHVVLDKCEEIHSRCLDMKVTLSLYLNVSEMHEWKQIRMGDFLDRVERALTREFSKPMKGKHRVLLFEEE